MHYRRLMQYVSEAGAVYGDASVAWPVATLGYMPVRVSNFRPRVASFQAALYRDAGAGRYRIAFAGSDEWRGDRLAASGLPLHDLGDLARSFAERWHPEMRDALDFTRMACKQIERDLIERGATRPGLLLLQSAVDITGHSIGGALAELCSEMFGLNGFSIDGPGIAAMLDTPEYVDLHVECCKAFPDLGIAPAQRPGSFFADAFSVIGAAGRHPPGVETATLSDAAASYPLPLRRVRGEPGRVQRAGIVELARVAVGIAS